MAGDRIHEVRIELSRLAARKDELERELRRLQQELPQDTPKKYLPTPDSKVDLFLRMFRCRESLYPRFWENRAKGTSGYSPACDNEWVKGVCGKPPNGRVRCSECLNQAFPALDEAAVRAHLSGQAIIGTYAIREDDSCVFLACDFDGRSWHDDAFLYRRIAGELGIDALVERSKSGAGAHVWIFFAQPVPARLASMLPKLSHTRLAQPHVRLGSAPKVKSRYSKGSYSTASA